MWTSTCIWINVNFVTRVIYCSPLTTACKLNLLIFTKRQVREIYALNMTGSSLKKRWQGKSSKNIYHCIQLHTNVNTQSSLEMHHYCKAVRECEDCVTCCSTGIFLWSVLTVTALFFFSGWFGPLPLWVDSKLHIWHGCMSLYWGKQSAVRTHSLACVFPSDMLSSSVTQHQGHSQRNGKCHRI